MKVPKERAELVLGLFETYYERVYCFARQSLEANRAEDIAQEVFTRLLERENIESMTLSVSYLLKIADNLIKRRYRRSQQFGRYLDAKGRHTEFAQRNKVQERRGPGEREIDRALGRLSRVERDAIDLIVCKDLSYDDAALSLGVPTSTINNWKYRGIQKLKRELSKEPVRERANDPRSDERVAAQQGESARSPDFSDRIRTRQPSGARHAVNKHSV
jgi:RNA polymerase sigma factor (sigma-70 family)